MNRLRTEQSVLCFLFAILIASVQAQSSNTGGISGYVRDKEKNTPISGVNMTVITATGTPQHFSAQTDGNGFYHATDLPPADYFVYTEAQGYIDVLYDDALKEEDKIIIKVSSGETVEHIDFKLERGASISGHLYDAATGAPVSRVSVRGDVVNSANINGAASSDHNGRYLIWSEFPTGLVKVHAPYFLDPSEYILEPDSVQTVSVQVPDTTLGVDFYLRRGGTIAGRVLDEDLQPLSDLNVNIEKVDGQVTRTITTRANGTFTSPGLASGYYKVGVVHNVDLMKYHTEYYNDTPRSEEAERVQVTPPQQTRIDDILLSRVVYRTISNEYIAATVTDRYPGNNLSVGNTGGLPEVNQDNDKVLLFGHPSPHTSFTTLRIDQWDTKFGSDQGDFVQAPVLSNNNTTITRTWKTRNIKVTQNVSLVTSTWSQSQYDDTVELLYRIINQDNTSHHVGIRVLLDTMLGSNDGAMIRIPYSRDSDFEREFLKELPPGLPPWWTAIEGDLSNPIFSVQGTLTEANATIPDRFVTAAWSHIFYTKWDYEISSDRRVTDDSAVALWWNPVSLAPNDTLTVVTYYGLGEASPDTVPPYVEQWSPENREIVRSNDPLVQFILKDDFRGVDKLSLSVGINDEMLPASHIDLNGDPNAYKVTCRLMQPLKYGQEVTVRVNARDLAWVPNVMPTAEIRFQVRGDNKPPFVTDRIPSAGAVGVDREQTISFHVRDSLSGVHTDSLSVWLNDVQAACSLDGDSSNYNVTVQHAPFTWNDTVRIMVKARDLALPPNIMPTEEWQFITCEDTTKSEHPVANVHPNPFTPNGDGYNDVVYFEIQESDLEALIFNLKGAEIRRIKASGSEKIMWDGKDKTGARQLPGVYIYLLRRGSHIIDKGTIVLAL